MMNYLFKTLWRSCTHVAVVDCMNFFGGIQVILQHFVHNEGFTIHNLIVTNKNKLLPLEILRTTKKPFSKGSEFAL